MEKSPGDITTLLGRWSDGDGSAFDALVPLIYDECRRIAARQLRRERDDHTLDPTALVHELYLLLVDQRRATWANRAHFFGIAAQLMRRDSGRSRSREAHREAWRISNVRVTRGGHGRGERQRR